VLLYTVIDPYPYIIPSNSVHEQSSTQWFEHQYPDLESQG